MPTPVYDWTVFLVDRRPGGAGIQDVTAYHQDGQSNLRGEARSKTEQKRLYLWIDDDAAIACDDMMEVWAGWFDHAGNTWHPTKQPYGGYVLQHTGEQDGTIHTIDCLLTGYGWWASNTAILSWPAEDPDDTPIGFPEDMTVQDWIETGFTTSGGVPVSYEGIVRAHSTTVACDGIAPALSTFTIPVASLPGIPMIEQASVTGSFDFVYIADALNELTRAIHDADSSKRPLLFWRAKAVGAELVPQLCMIDQNDVSGDVIITVEASDTPATGHIVPRQPFKHLRDATHAAQGVIVKGIGGDPTIGGNPLVYWVEIVDAHRDAYPNYHSARGTWDLIKTERTIATISEAQTYAQRIEPQVWGPRGELSIVLERDDLAALSLTVDDIQEGLCLRYIDTVEGLDGVYPITKVAPFDDTGIMVTFGFTPLDVGDLLIGGTSETPWVREGLSAAEYAKRQVIGAPKFVPPTLTPQTVGQNKIQARWQDVSGLHIAGTAAIAPTVLDPSTIVPAPLFKVTPALVSGSTTETGFRVNEYGVAEPQEYHFGAQTTPGTVRGFVVRRGCKITQLCLVGTGSVSLLQGTGGVSTAVAGPYSVTAGGHIDHAWAGTTFNHSDTIDLEVHSVTDYIYVTASAD